MNLMNVMMNEELVKSYFNGTYYELHHATTGYQNKQQWIILIHGLGASCLQFKNLYPHFLSMGYHVLMYDLIGRGKSAPPTTGIYGVEEHVQQLLHLLQHLGMVVDNAIPSDGARLHLLGISMGGAVAALFASEYSHLLQSLILLAPAGIVAQSALQYIPYVRYGLPLVKPLFMLWGIREQYLRHSRPTTTATTTNTTEEGDTEVEEVVAEPSAWSFTTLSRYYHRTEVFWHCFQHFPFHDITPHLKRLAAANTHPKHSIEHRLAVLIMWGTKDQTIPYANAATWETLLGSATSRCAVRVHPILDGKHGLIPAHNDEIVEQIQSLFSSLSSSS